MTTTTRTNAAATETMTVGLTSRQIDNRAKKLQSLEAQIKALEAEKAALQDEIKADMGDAEEISTGKFIIKFQTITSNRFDSTAFKKDHPEEYAAYTKASTSRRFTLKAIA